MPQINDESCANPLLLSWVKEWWDTARQRSTKGVTTYKHAYDSLKACPITFQHPSELQKLKGFGPKLCERLTVQLQTYCKEEGLPMPEHPLASKKRKGRSTVSALNGIDADELSISPPAKKPRKVKPYVPAYRSGAYALVVALSAVDKSAPPGLSKQDLIEAAQPYSDSSFTAPSAPNQFYTAWNSMKTLLSKELVGERGIPTKRYSLTDEGWEVAKRIQETINGGSARQTVVLDSDNKAAATQELGARPAAFSTRAGAISDHDDEPPLQKPDYDNVVTNGHAISDQSALPSFTPIILKPGSFTVHLVLDAREKRARNDVTSMRDNLTELGAQPIVRVMNLADAQWVAKCHDPDFPRCHGPEGDEIVLDYIVERKRLDDLIGSIKDGRFREQKFRLKRSGVKNVTYIIEQISLDQHHYQKYEEAVESVIASTQVVNGFTVKKTQNLDETCRYLARMTSMLKKKYEGRPLKVIPTSVITAQNYLPLLTELRAREPSADYCISYPAFASLASKSKMLTLRDLFLKMLMCTKGVTGEKAIEIQKVWKTPRDFMEAFERCGSGEEGLKRKRELVSNQLGNNVRSKQIGKVLSMKIAGVWGDAGI